MSRRFIAVAVVALTAASCTRPPSAPSAPPAVVRSVDALEPGPARPTPLHIPRPPPPEPSDDYTWLACRPMKDAHRLSMQVASPMTLETYLRAHLTPTCGVAVVSRNALQREAEVELGSGPLSIAELRARFLKGLKAFGMTTLERDGVFIIVERTAVGPGPEPTSDERAVVDMRGGWEKTSAARAREREGAATKLRKSASALAQHVVCSADRGTVDAEAVADLGGRPARARLVARKAGGFKIYATPKSTLLTALGIRGGDTLIRWSGPELAPDADDLERGRVFEDAVMQAAADGGTLRLELETKDGTARTLDVEFQR